MSFNRLVEEQDRPSYDCNADCDDQTCHCYIPPKIFYPYMDHSLILNAKLEDEVMGSYFERRALRSLGNYDDVIKRKHFRVTGHLWGEFPGDRRIPLTKASDADLWYFRWSAPDKR